jgi:hypothetical protein
VYICGSADVGTAMWRGFEQLREVRRRSQTHPPRGPARAALTGSLQQSGGGLGERTHSRSIVDQGRRHGFVACQATDIA